MASRAALAIVLGFAAAFWCLEPLESASKIQASAMASPVDRLAAGVLMPAALATFGLNLLLLAAHVRALDGANAAGDPVPGRLARATLAAAAAALLAGAALRLVADGHLGGADDVGWLNTH